MPRIDPDQAGLVNTMREKQRKSQFSPVWQPLLRKKSRVVYCVTYQRPGNFERIQQSACRSMLSCYLIDGAGHWVQQEQPAKVR